MTLLFCDGFDHYGTDTTNMTDGAYAQVDGSSTQFILTPSNPRTGTSSLRRDDIADTFTFARRVLGGAKTTVGQGAAVYLSQLPTNADSYCLYDFRDTNNVVQISVLIQTTGIIEVIRGIIGGTILGTSVTPAIVAQAYTHIETLVTFSQSAGSVEVRVNGVTIISEVSLDTVESALSECSQVAIVGGGQKSGVAADHEVTTDFDDYYCYDDTGSYNNTFLGDRSVITSFPDADTALTDWTRNTGSADFDAINEADPDDDTTYIFANPGGSPGDVSEFDFEDLPEGVSAISGILLVNRSRKTDSGSANAQASIVSATNEIAGTDNPMTEAYTYYHDVIEVDPDTSAPFTTAALDAAKLKLERTD